MASVCIDIDGVIGDFIGWFREYYKTQLVNKGRTVPTLTEPSDYRLWECPDWGFDGEDDFKDALWEFEAGCGYRFIEPYEGVQNAMRELKDMGFHVIVSTTRKPSTRYPLWGSEKNLMKPETLIRDTVWWLGYHHIPYDSLHFGPKTDIRAGIYVDDEPEALRELTQLDSKPVVYRVERAWNHDADGVPCGSLAEVAERLWIGQKNMQSKHGTDRVSHENQE